MHEFKPLPNTFGHSKETTTSPHHHLHKTNLTVNKIRIPLKHRGNAHILIRSIIKMLRILIIIFALGVDHEFPASN